MRNIISSAFIHNGLGLVAVCLIAKFLDDHPTPVPYKPYYSTYDDTEY